ncbi:MAG: barstar family protein [Elusimicrobia bacterium]|nr:barstar family protein [Elusimicrobiota bacterium]
MPPGAGGLFLDLKGSASEEEVLKRFPPPDYFTAFIDGSAARDKAGLLAAVSSAFRFPAYFGGNWDALLDCLRSLPNEVPAKGYVLAVRDPASFLSASPADLEDFRDIAEEARAFLKEKFGATLLVVLL